MTSSVFIAALRPALRPTPQLARRAIRLRQLPHATLRASAQSRWCTARPASATPIASSIATPHAEPTVDEAVHAHHVDADVTERAIARTKEWLLATSTNVPKEDLVASLSADPHAVPFIMKFTDHVMRPSSASVAAGLLTQTVSNTPLPSFFKKVDAAMLKAAAMVAPLMPSPVMAAARLRMMQLVEPFVGIVEKLRLDGRQERNVNLLGEAVLGEKEALRRREEAEMMLEREGVKYVSVKTSGVCAQLNRWDYEGSLERVLESLRPLLRKAKRGDVLVNLDMEEYHDLEITIDAFIALLEEEEFKGMNAGIVLQTYLPDAFPALQKLVEWANNRDEGEIKIRLVKGANLAMEKVESAIRGWTQAPYATKEEVDANYLRCLDWVATPERLQRVRIGVASHNLFLLAYAHELARERGVTDRIGFEMLQGMTPAHTPHLAKQGHGMLLYTPVCRMRDFDVSIAYLFRRFEETSSEGNFLRSLPALKPGSEALELEEERFRRAAARKKQVAVGPRRAQARPALASMMTVNGDEVFLNEPDTDPSLPSNRAWALDVIKSEHFEPFSGKRMVNSVEEIRSVLDVARNAASDWASKSKQERKERLVAVADVFARRRGELINAMVHEGGKTFEQADAEISEAIDFAHYYARSCETLPDSFEPFGVVCVAGPWNFPVAIPSGGVLAALAAGNAVVLKPSVVTSRCGELVAECMWEAGVGDAVQMVQTDEGEVGKEFTLGGDAVVLTGATDTAELFQGWNKDLKLFAETSGKNAMIITPAADIDLAVADLVNAAFSNSGQKCSASSLAICVGDVYESDRFRRQLQDAVQSLEVGVSSDIATVVGPLATPPEEKLTRALTQLDEGEEWLVEPRKLDDKLWTPGVRLGVGKGSWFHKTEAFGPVLGVMHAKDLDEAIGMQNGTRYGLTGGIHSLDRREIDKWMDEVEVGNAYVNKGITGALVQRQSFGGWKKSVVGPGGKAGGPNYVMQFGVIQDGEVRNERWLEEAIKSDERAWREHFGREHDLTGLFCESNVFRYRALPRVAVRVGEGADEWEVKRVGEAVERCGVGEVVWSRWDEESVEEFVGGLGDVGRIRTVGKVEDEVVEEGVRRGVHVARDGVVGDGRVELLHYLREQAVSWTKHRFGNLVTA